MLRKKILVVGGVAGGASCAVRARRLDENADIVILEQGSYVSFANCGLPYHIGKVIPDRENLIVATPEMFESWFNIDVRTENRVLSVNTKERLIEVENIEDGEIYKENYDSLVLSPGAFPKIPPITGVTLPGIFSLHDIPDTLSIIERLEKVNSRNAVVLGGGFIGLELAENLLNLDLKVSIIESLDHIVPILDKEMSLFVQKHASKMNLKIHLDCSVSKFESDKRKNNDIKIYLSSGEIINAGIVIIAAGVSPKNNLAVNAGLKVGKHGGIKVNRFMQTSDPNIWAVGDVIEVNEFISGHPSQIPMAGPANRQGRIAAESIIKCKTNFESKGFRGSQATSILGFLGMTVASTGLNEKKIKKMKEKKSLEYEKVHVYAYHHADYYPNAKKIILKLIFSKEKGTILGAQALGFSGVDKRIDVIATAIQNKATVFDLSQAELCYAPQYGSAKDIVNIAGMVASNVLNNYLNIVHWNEIDPKNKIILDVRESFVYKREHFKGAINIPLDELRGNLDKLDKDKEIMVYCTEGKRSYFACRILTQKGFRASSFSGGFSIYKNEMA